MSELSSIFVKAGFNNVSTYGASGNVLFEDKDEECKIKHRICAAFMEAKGHEVRVFIRRITYLMELIDSHHFDDSVNSERYVVFRMDEIGSNLPSLHGRGYEVVLIGSDAIIRSFKTNGVQVRPGIEGLFGEKSTTRSLRVVEKIVAMARKLNLSC
jgi:uncharacterized protein (DUF1697 family)